MNIENRNVTPAKNHFYRMIGHLLQTNEVVLFGRVDKVLASQEQSVINLLRNAYQEESLGYPFDAPSFDEKAASWSAKILFYTAQLVLYREHTASSLSEIITLYEYDMTDSAILTADLSLRFIPDLLRHLEDIDVEDELIPILKSLLRKWHYSGLLSKITLEGLVFSNAFDNKCLQQLYVDRVIEEKQIKVAQLSNIKPLIKSGLGNYEQLFWKDFNLVL